jgi:hypothetical protein
MFIAFKDCSEEDALVFTGFSSSYPSPSPYPSPVPPTVLLKTMQVFGMLPQKKGVINTELNWGTCYSVFFTRTLLAFPKLETLNHIKAAVTGSELPQPTHIGFIQLMTITYYV